MCAIIADSLMSTSNEMCGGFLVHTYRLTHGFRPYTGNIPEVLISTEGISLYTSKAMC